MKELIYPEEGTLKFSWRKTVWLYFMIIPCFFIDWTQWSMSRVVVGILLTFTTICLGHSIGLHRGVIHKSYKTSKTFRNLSVYFFILTGLGGPISWMKLHYYRDYWQNNESCPKYFGYEHSLIKDFLWNLHLSFTPKDLNKYGIPKEDLTNRWFKWLEKTWYLHNIGLAVVVYILSDFNTMLMLVFFRSAMTILGHWYIGYASHKYGYSHFEIHHAKESAFNDVLLGLISFGEGFHNNHHAHPSSAKFGVKWYEFDLGWHVIRVLKKIKLIDKVKNHQTHQTLKKLAETRNKILCRMPFQ
jgi:stearoyl-CoA desaturase (delta-9 desaturase)